MINTPLSHLGIARQLQADLQLIYFTLFTSAGPLRV